VADAGLPSKGRIEALTDGIFAVAMTLLVLDLKLPEPMAGLDDAGLRRVLIALLPKFEIYIISYLVLGVFWLGHHRLMTQMRGVDHLFLWRNLVFVLLITLVPFSTSIMGEHRELYDAPLLYGANLALVLATQCLMWQRAVFHLMDLPRADAAARWRAVRNRYLLALGVVGAALLAAALGWRFAAYLYLLLFAVGTLRPKPIVPQ